MPKNKRLCLDALFGPANLSNLSFVIFFLLTEGIYRCFWLNLTCSGACFYTHLFSAFIGNLFLADNQYDEDDDEITPDLWQEACWIVIR